MCVREVCVSTSVLLRFYLSVDLVLEHFWKVNIFRSSPLQRAV